MKTGYAIPLISLAVCLGVAGCSNASVGAAGGSVAGNTDSTYGNQSLDVDVQSEPGGTDATVADNNVVQGSCVACLGDEDCASGDHCAQFQGGAFCASPCSSSCADGFACQTVSSNAGDPVTICVPTAQPCGVVVDPGANDAGSTPVDTGSSAGGCPGYVGPNDASCCTCQPGKTCAPNGCYNGYVCTPACKCSAPPANCAADAGPSPDSGPVDSGSAPSSCGSLDGPTVSSCCKCTEKSGVCAANNCFGGWFCNHDSCKCQAAPDPSTCGGGPDAGSVDAGPTQDVPNQPGAQGLTATGGTIASLAFGIIGDTRPPSVEAVNAYPTAVITKIWQDMEGEAPHVPLVVTTGDYQFSKSSGTGSASQQFDLYLSAQKAFSGLVLYAMGNHECTGAVNSNCGLGNADSLTGLYNLFMQKMLAPVGLTKPYYVTQIAAKDGSWNAKFVFIAANAWDTYQAAWLDSTMQIPTTYTFVVRHEGTIATEAPGVSPSATIFNKYPYTLLICGHTHTLAWYPKEKQIVVGNGGAPLATGVNYGYVVVRQRSDKALEVKAFDYSTHAVMQQFVLTPAGTVTK